MDSDLPRPDDADEPDPGEPPSYADQPAAMESLERTPHEPALPPEPADPLDPRVHGDPEEDLDNEGDLALDPAPDAETPPRRIAWSRLLTATGLAALGAALANVALFLLFRAVGIIPAEMMVAPPGGEAAPLGLVNVVFASIMPALGAGALFAAFLGLARRPVRLFWIVATVVLLLSLGSPFQQPDVPRSAAFALDVLHMVAFLVIGYVLTTRGTPRRDRLEPEALQSP